MKNTVLAFVLIFFFCFRSFAQWKDVTPPFPGFHYDIELSVVSSQTAYLFSQNIGNYMLASTHDGGNTWEIKDLTDWADSLDILPQKIHFPASDTGYICSRQYSNQSIDEVFKTTDGGNTWNSIPLPDSTPIKKVRLLHFFNTRQGVLMLFTGEVYTYRIFTTEDGGQNWEEHVTLPRGIKYFHLRPEGSGIAISNNANGNDTKMYQVSDFGATWQLLDTADISTNWPTYRQFIFGSFFNGYYINDSIGYSLYTENTTPYGPKIHHLTVTTDGGNTWTNDGLTWIEHLFEGRMESKDESLWIFTSHYVFRRDNPTTATRAIHSDRSVSITPMPCPNGASVRFLMNENYTGKANISIFHTTGKIVQHTTLEFLNGEANMDVIGFPAGLYFVAIEDKSGGRAATGKLIVH